MREKYALVQVKRVVSALGRRQSPPFTSSCPPRRRLPLAQTIHRRDRGLETRRVSGGCRLRSFLKARNLTGSHAYESRPWAEAASSFSYRFTPPWQTFVLFCVLFGLCAYPILAVKVPPLIDYPAHLARMHILNNPMLFSKYFEIKWGIIPNLAVDLVVPIFAKIFDIFLAGQLFILLTFALITSGTIAIHYTLYQKWVGPLLSFLFLFNGIFLCGFLNYQFAIGIALWATAGWIALRNSFWLMRATYSTGAVLILFFCHLGGVGLYAVALFSYELSRLISSKRQFRRGLMDLSVMAAPFLIAVLLMLASRTSNDWGSIHPPMAGFAWKWKGPYMIFKSTDLLLDAIFFCFMVLFSAYLLNSRRLRIPCLAWIFVMVSGIVYLVIPDILFGATILDMRLPAAFVFFLIAMVSWRIETPRATAVFYVIIIVVLLVRVSGVAKAWQSYQEIVSDFERSFVQIDPATRILVAEDGSLGWRGTSNSVSVSTDMATISFLPTLSVIERSCLAPLFAEPGQQILVLKDPSYRNYWREPWNPYKNEWRKHFDYVYVLYAPPGSQPRVAHAKLLYQGQSFQLYKISRHGDCNCNLTTRTTE